MLLNDDDLTYAKVRLDPRSLRTVVDHIHKLASPLTRAVLLGRDLGHVPRRRAAGRRLRRSGAPRASATESDLTAVGHVLGQAQSAADSYAPLGPRPRCCDRWQNGVRRAAGRRRAGIGPPARPGPAFAAAATTTPRPIGWPAGCAARACRTG